MSERGIVRFAAMALLSLALAFGTAMLPTAPAHAAPGGLSGRVTAAAGVDLTGVSVDAYGQEDQWAGGTYVGADGTFLLEELEEGTYRLEFRDTNGQLAPVELSGVIVFAGPATPIEDVGMVAVAKVTGTVSGPAGVDLTGVSVGAFGQEGQWVGNAYVEADGTYVLTPLEAGTYRLEFRDSSGQLAAVDLSSVIVNAEETTSGQDVVMVAVAKVSGTVSGPTGVDLTGVSVEAFDQEGQWVGSAYVEADGTYVLAPLEAGTYRLEFRDSNGQLAPQERSGVIVTSGETTPGQDVVMVAVGTVTGTVSGPADVDLTSVSVEAVDQDDQSAGNAYVGADGAYVLASLEAGTYRLEFRDLNGQLAPVDLSGVIVTAGETNSGQDVVMVAAEGMTGSVTGTVTGPAGVDLTGVFVEAVDQEGMVAGSVNVESDGTYVLASLEAGIYRLEFRDSNEELAPADLSGVTVTAGETTSGQNVVMVALEAADGSVTGTVSGPAGVDLTGVRVDAYAADWTWMSGGDVDASGRYRLTGLDTGTYRLMFTDDNYELITKWLTGVSVTAGETTTAPDVTLIAYGKLTGTVSGPPGADLSGVTVRAYDEDDNWRSFAVGPTGAYTVGGLTTGFHRLEFRDANDGLSQGYVSYVKVTSGQTTSDQNITLTASGTISGRVSGPAGVVFDRVVVVAQDEDGDERGRA